MAWQYDPADEDTTPSTVPYTYPEGEDDGDLPEDGESTDQHVPEDE